MTENEIATKALDICFSVHRKTGPGLFESVYEKIFCYELERAGIKYSRQSLIPVLYDEIIIPAGFRADVIIENKVLVELKSVDKLIDTHYKQVTTYLKLTNLKLGLLINFNVGYLKNGIHRVVNGL